MTQEFLDSKQYTELSILRYEQIYGYNYISPGGEEVTDQFINTLNLRPQMRVLDIGCGLGGPAFRMAGKHGVHVHGIDLSANMIRIAKTRLKEKELNNLVTFSQANCLELQAFEKYDVIHSRDVFLHISDKDRLFEVIRRILVAGGQLAFSDYCLGATKPSP
ncbi:MAG: methyltransferase domain-containing protein, partial [SAR324 cluster bacterium]|nr:methyltransferase domain-containing protein [SAR324 cluster bacterium]